MTRANNTLHAFNQGQKDREAYPLRLGGYKLREARDAPKSIKRTINNITTYVRGKPCGYTYLLGHCTTDDAAIWLKRVPAMIARELTYNVLPAIEALAADGVPEAIVRQCANRAQAEAKIILSQCEAAEATLRQGVKHEYRLMKAGNSTLLPVVDALEDLIENTLRAVKDWI